MRKFLVLSAVALAAAALTSPARADEASEKVVKKAIEAHGGAKALAAAKAATMSLKATMSIMGIEIELTGDAAYSFPDKFKTTLTGEAMGQKLAIVQVANGDKVKMSINGMALPVSDKQKEELKQAVVTQEIGMIAPLLDKKFTLTAEKDEKVGADEAAVMSVKAKGMKDLKLFFDKKTGMLVRMQRKGLDPMEGEVDEVSDLSDYKKVDGVLTPMTIKVSHDGKAFMTMKMSDVKYAEKLDAKTFGVDD